MQVRPFFARLRTRPIPHISKTIPKGETIIEHYHSVTYLAREYLHHDWHNEEILTANKHQSL